MVFQVLAVSILPTGNGMNINPPDTVASGFNKGLGMRQILRKWLGIEKIENSFLESTQEPKDSKLRRLIGEAVITAFEGKGFMDWEPSLCFYRTNNTLGDALKSAARDMATEALTAEIERQIKPEAFIDEIIARIQRKQLK